MFQGGTSVFLTMYRNKNIEKLILVDKQKITEKIEFTRLKGTFEEKIMFSYMVYNEKVKIKNKQKIFETLDFTKDIDTF